MIKEEILKQVEQRLGALNHDARCAVEVAIEVMTAASENATTRLQPLPPFEESNPSWEEMTRLNLGERSCIMQELEGNYSGIAAKRRKKHNESRQGNDSGPISPAPSGPYSIPSPVVSCASSRLSSYIGGT
jgi:hypothetical protein